jgi:hypothetical protein
MTSAVHAASTRDHTELRHVLRSSAILGVIQSVLVVGFALLSRILSGPLELVVQAAIVIVGVAATAVLPGIWTRAATIEGIAGAAGIGLGATAVFLVVDVVLLQPLGLYGNRWHEIGGGSNWWYHPVWWMVGTYLSWMGAWALANQTARSGAASPVAVIGGTVVIAAIVMAAAAVLGFPGAAFGVGSFSVAILPALAVMVVVTGLGARRP